MKLHKLKTWPDYYYRVYTGQKNFEVRKHDRDFQIGDQLLLQEFDPEKNDYTGRELRAEITYILIGGQFGIESGYCVLSIQQ